MSFRTKVCAAALALLTLLPAAAEAGPWTRDQGSFYVQLGYARLRARSRFLTQFGSSGRPGDRGNFYTFCPEPPPGGLDCSYIQHLVGLYGEVGLVQRWLTVIVDATLLRSNEIENLGRTLGLGDGSVGLWTGLVVRPVRLSFGLTVGVPLGDPHPRAGPGADELAQVTANTLPTGDGEWDVEGRLSLGHSFGRRPRWPLEHYLIAEAGYWLRTGRFPGRGGGTERWSDSFVYRFELGTRLPWPLVERLWWVLKLYGVESFASDAQAATGATGLGNGVTYVQLGGQLLVRLGKGFGLVAGYERPVRGRTVLVGDFVRVGLSFSR